MVLDKRIMLSLVVSTMLPSDNNLLLDANSTAGHQQQHDQANVGNDFSGVGLNRLPAFIIPVLTVYCVIFLLGLAGNLLVLYVVIRKPAMQSITNIFIANLAASDVMMCLLAVPFTPISAFLNSWVFGDALCHILPMMLCVSVYVSTLTSTAIAVDRYIVIVHPFKPRIKTIGCLQLIAAIWLISITISLPLAIFQQVNKPIVSQHTGKKYVRYRHIRADTHARLCTARTRT